MNETIIKKNSAIDLTVSVLFRPILRRNPKWFPYLAVGAGYLVEVEKWEKSSRQDNNYYFYSSSEMAHKWNFCLGGGIKYGFTNKIGVCFDGRFLIKLDHSDGETQLVSFGPRITGGFYIKL